MIADSKFFGSRLCLFFIILHLIMQLAIEILQKRFVKLWHTLSKVKSDTSTIFTELIEHYGEPQRYYHNLTHITECLGHLDSLELPIQSQHVIELAIWFHDVIYATQAKDNELQSAEFFQKRAIESGIEQAIIAKVYQMIVATAHHQCAEQDLITPTFLDIDLAILGAAPERFAEYDKAIRKEYAWVPDMVYNPKRKQILSQFLQREQIYFTPELRAKYEAQARKNLSAIL